MATYLFRVFDVCWPQSLSDYATIIWRSKTSFCHKYIITYYAYVCNIQYFFHWPVRATLIAMSELLTAISLQQPYANWVAEGRKKIETRTWTTKYRGDLLICASQSGKGTPKGVALCVVELYGIRLMTEADEEAACIRLYPRAKAWLIRNVRVLDEPLPVKGKLSLYKVKVEDDFVRRNDINIVKQATLF